MRRRILRFMHVDWNGAKQRPHFLAEGISARHEVPLPGRLAAGVRLVYDCMDDAPSLEGRAGGRDGLLAAEAALVRRADLVLASGDDLARKLVARGCPAERLVVVRNAFGGRILDPPPPRPRRAEDPFRVGYVGTISGRIDFEALARCAEALPGVEFHFLGPADVPLPEAPGLFFHGPVDHERLAEAVRDFDCFIVPFRRTPLVESVDPVKIYDYVNFGRNVVCLAYGEVMRYQPFVHFYRDAAGLVDVVGRLRSANVLKYSSADRLAFLRESGWASRVERVEGALARLWPAEPRA